ncbi:cytochrome c551 [Peribacillus deserti]|uniref:Cytochrome c551 n=1 Tax=Peribacillus deserti TaxID=673318 RepID=A0ABS2QEG1_9BACI|nr:cytochrome c [Peribacillus deserti]MBM7690908.1 cytochrome c551 [Peribacillus deserti]
MKKKLIMLLLGTSLALAACGNADNGEKENANQENGSENAGSVAGNGEKLYQKNCSSCHGGNLEGGFGPDLTNIGSAYSEAEITNIIKKGKGQMPPNILKGDDAKVVAGWLAEKK